MAFGLGAGLGFGIGLGLGRALIDGEMYGRTTRSRGSERPALVWCAPQKLWLSSRQPLRSDCQLRRRAFAERMYTKLRTPRRPSDSSQETVSGKMYTSPLRRLS